MTPGEIAALQNIQGATTELQAILTRVLNQARSQIKAGGNQVDQPPPGAGATVPDSVAQDCIEITRWKWLCSFPALRAFKTAEREKAHDAAQKHLSGIAGQNPNRERVELPPNTDPTPAAVPQPFVGRPKPKIFGMRAEDGIV